MVRSGACRDPAPVDTVGVRAVTPGERLRGVLPQQVDLPEPLWRARHRALLGLLVAHVVLLLPWALLNGHPVAHVLWPAAGLTGLAALGAAARSRTVAASAVSSGLVVAAALVVHAGEGRTVLHFHFFVVVAALALYRQWAPFVLAVLLVLGDHAVMSQLSPQDVYDDAFSLSSPWLAVALHGGYVLAAAAVSAVAWTWAERERQAAEARAAEEAANVRRSERRLAGLLDNAPVSIFVKDLEGRFLSVNPEMQRLLGRAEDQVLGRTSADVFDDALADDPHDREVASSLQASERQELVRLPGGSERTFSIVKFPLLDDGGRITAVAGIGVDVTDRLRAEAALEWAASHDALTGLPNRALLLQRIDEALAQPDHPVAVLFVDLDGFKEVNDSAGHDAGDAVLSAVARRLDRVREPGQVLARLGGDEFVLCCPGLDTEQGLVVAERLVAVLRDPTAVDGRTVDIGASIGVAAARADEGATPMLLLRDADTALYAAKAAGRDRAVAFTRALREGDERRRRLQADLAAALRDGGRGLLLEYQPVAEVTTGVVVGVEALVRWQHPVDGLLAPDAFLPLAADKGLLPALDRWVLRTACATAVDWSGPRGPVSLAVNLTPQALAGEDVLSWVAGTCAETGFAAGRLVLELTETAVLERPTEASTVLAALRSTGVRVALDDFGTGWSSMSHLRDLPVDQVKIDRSFTAGAASDPRDRAIVRATADLAAALGLELVAEGVETPEQRRAVAEVGCTLLQGWHLSRPLPPEKVPAALVGPPAPRRSTDDVVRPLRG
jgi:diguanylate cyclase (GGDEF)-like protein/PAS domain S-box-containing protein